MKLRKKLNKLLILFNLLISFIIIPLNAEAYSKTVALGGETIGIDISSSGIMIVGFYDVNGISPGKDAALKPGDIITRINGEEVNSIEDLSKSLQSINLKITYLRNGQEQETILKVIKEDNTYKTGIYVKDKVVGVGTLTFIDPNTNIYGALGHEIKDQATKIRFEVKDGFIYSSTVTDIKKSEVNSPGEKNARFDSTIGTISKNTKAGIFGKYTVTIKNDMIPIADPSEITTGSAEIRTTLTDNIIKNYAIEILKILDNDSSKNILFKIIDSNLIDKTGGIVQGMSGSPIIQNNKLIGAVNYVVVDDPLKGYGVFITNMLKEIDN